MEDTVGSWNCADDGDQTSEVHNQKPFYLKALRVVGWSVGLLTSQGSRELFDSVALREGYKLLLIPKGDTQGTVHTGIYCIQGISVSQDLS